MRGWAAGCETGLGRVRDRAAGCAAGLGRCETGLGRLRDRAARRAAGLREPANFWANCAGHYLERAIP